MICSFFFFNDTATTEIYTLSLHDALPILALLVASLGVEHVPPEEGAPGVPVGGPVDAEAADDLVHVQDRKSTRLNSSHANISYAVFCLKKKKKTCTAFNPIIRLINVMRNK